MKAYNRRNKPKHSTKIRFKIKLFNFKKIKLVYPNDESMIFKNVIKPKFNLKYSFGVKRQVVFKIKDDIDLSCVTGSMMGFSGSKNYWEVGLLNKGELILSTVTPGLTAKIIETLIKELKEVSSLDSMMNIIGGLKLCLKKN